jgi:Flp pilus assembly protein TadG
MNLWKMAIVVVLLGVVGLFAYDGVQVLDARRNISDTASAAASAAAHTIATSKDCADAQPATPATPATPAATTATTAAAATATATAATTTTDCRTARAVADKMAKSQGDVVTSFTYDAVAARVSVTVSGSANSLVLHYFDRNVTDNIHASSSARPA